MDWSLSSFLSSALLGMALVLIGSEIFLKNVM